MSTLEREVESPHFNRMSAKTSIRSWLSRIDKDTKAKRNKGIFAAWMSCHTLETIAERERMPQRTVADVVAEFSDFGNLSESAKADANHITNYDWPLYNVWKFREKTKGVRGE